MLCCTHAIVAAVHPCLLVNGTSDIFSLMHASSDQIVVKRRLHRPAHQALFVQSSSDFDNGVVLLGVSHFLGSGTP